MGDTDPLSVSLRSKRFQSSYCVKVRADKKRFDNKLEFFAISLQLSVLHIVKCIVQFICRKVSLGNSKV